MWWIKGDGVEWVSLAVGVRGDCHAIAYKVSLWKNSLHVRNRWLGIILFLKNENGFISLSKDLLCCWCCLWIKMKIGLLNVLEKLLCGWCFFLLIGMRMGLLIYWIRIWMGLFFRMWMGFFYYYYASVLPVH